MELSKDEVQYGLQLVNDKVDEVSEKYIQHLNNMNKSLFGIKNEKAQGKDVEEKAVSSLDFNDNELQVIKNIKDIVKTRINGIENYVNLTEKHLKALSDKMDDSKVTQTCVLEIKNICKKHNLSLQIEHELSSATQLGTGNRLDSVEGNRKNDSNEFNDFDNFCQKKVKVISDLSSGIKSNVEKFASLISECQTDFFKKSFSSLLPIKKDILRHISEQNIQMYKRNYTTSFKDSGSNWGDKLKALEELVFDQQCQLEVTFSKRDEIFSYFVNEANSFSRLTSKIGNELSLQSVALSKKIKKLKTFAPDAKRLFSPGVREDTLDYQYVELSTSGVNEGENEVQNLNTNNMPPSYNITIEPISSHKNHHRNISSPLHKSVGGLYAYNANEDQFRNNELVNLVPTHTPMGQNNGYNGNNDVAMLSMSNKELQNKNLELIRVITDLSMQLNSRNDSAENKFDAFNKAKENYELQFDSYNKNLKTIWDLMNQKIGIHEDRVQTLERFLKEKLNLLQKQSKQTNSDVYNTFISKLNEKIEDQSKRLNDTKIKLNHSQNDLKMSLMENEQKDKEISSLEQDQNSTRDSLNKAKQGHNEIQYQNKTLINDLNNLQHLNIPGPSIEKRKSCLEMKRTPSIEFVPKDLPSKRNSELYHQISEQNSSNQQQAEIIKQLTIQTQAEGRVHKISDEPNSTEMNSPNSKNRKHSIAYSIESTHSYHNAFRQTKGADPSGFKFRANNIGSDDDDESSRGTNSEGMNEADKQRFEVEVEKGKLISSYEDKLNDLRAQLVDQELNAKGFGKLSGKSKSFSSDPKIFNALSQQKAMELETQTQEKMNKKNEEIQLLMTNLDEKDAEINETNQRFKGLKKELERVSELVEKKERDRSSLNEQMTQKETRLIQTFDELENAKKEKEALAKEIKEWKKELQKVKEENANMHKHTDVNTEGTEKNTQNVKELEKLRERMIKFKEKIQEQEDQIDTLDTEKGELEESNTEQTEQVKDFTKRVTAKSKECEDLFKRNEKLRQEVVEFEKKMLVTCMDRDDHLCDKIALEKEVNAYKSVSSFQDLDNAMNTPSCKTHPENTNQNMEELKDELRLLFEVNDNKKFQVALQRMVRDVLNMRCKQQYGMNTINELSDSLRR